MVNVTYQCAATHIVRAESLAIGRHFESAAMLLLDVEAARSIVVEERRRAVAESARNSTELLFLLLLEEKPKSCCRKSVEERSPDCLRICVSIIGQISISETHGSGSRISPLSVRCFGTLFSLEPFLRPSPSRDHIVYHYQHSIASRSYPSRILSSWRRSARPHLLSHTARHP